MTQVYMLIPLAVAALTGCASSLPKMSEGEAQEIVSRFQPVGRWLIGDSVGRTAWLQPQNKSEPCKIFFHDDTAENGKAAFWEGASTSIYWDGNCSEGYAHGLGREFVETVQQGLTAELALYENSGEEPKYFYTASYDSHQYYYTALSPSADSEGHDILSTVSLLNVGRHDFSVTDQTYVHDRTTGIVHALEEHRYTGKWVLLRGYSPETSIRMEVSTHPADNYLTMVALLEGVRPVAIATLFRNGQSGFQVARGSGQEYVTFTESLIHFYSKELDASYVAIQQGSERLEESHRAMSMYKRRVCTGDVSVDFMDDVIYGQICLPDGDLSPYSAQLAQYQATQENLVAQELASVQARSQVAAQRSANNQAELAQALAGFSDSMTALQQQSAAFTQNMMNRESSPVDFGGSRATSTNCMVISNIVSCQSQ